MANVAINTAVLREKINKAFDKKAYPIIKARIEDQVADAKQEMIEAFVDHPVSRELEAGPDAQSSLFLGKGNLFAFFGFNRGDDPVGEVKGILEQNTKIKSVTRKNNSDGKYTVEARVVVPTYDELKEQTPLPWTTRSWLESVERGLLGLNNFIFGKFKQGPRPLSASGTGLETKNAVRSDDFTGIGNTFISQILRNFKDAIRGTTTKQSKAPKKFTSNGPVV